LHPKENNALAFLAVETQHNKSCTHFWN